MHFELRYVPFSSLDVQHYEIFVYFLKSNVLRLFVTNKKRVKSTINCCELFEPFRPFRLNVCNMILNKFLKFLR